MKKNSHIENQVVVTGLGVVSCLGIGMEKFWNSLVSGQSGISEITSIRGDKLPIRVAGEVKDFDPKNITSNDGITNLGKTSQFAIAAAQLALSDAGLTSNLSEIDRDKVGVVIGTTTGEQQVVEHFFERLSDSENDISEPLITQTSDCVISNNVADHFELGGLSVVLPAACSGGNFAIAYAYDLIRSGRLNMVLAGGADCLSRHFLYGFARLGALARERCQPFDKNRKGIIPGEGAGVLVMETLKSALDRGAHIYSEVLGYGISSDAYHPVAPDPQARGAVQAMKDALLYAHTSPQSVSYISAHGTGTIINDRIETNAIKHLFGEHAYRIPISSIKSMIGHPSGAASALEAIVCNLAIERGVIPPTINYEEPDPDCDLDYVPNASRQVEVDIAMNNSQAFLGSNASVIFGKVRR